MSTKVEILYSYKREGLIMGLFDGLTMRNNNTSDQEERNLTSYSTSITSLLGNEEEVSETDVLKIPTALACLELISGSVAQLPVYLYKEDESGDVERIRGDKREYLLNIQPNAMMNGHNFKKNIVKDYLLYGGSYTKIEGNGSDVEELYPLPAERVNITKYTKQGYKVDADIKLSFGGGEKPKYAKFKPYELVTILKDSEDGITSKGLLETSREVFKAAEQEKDYSSNVLKRGALPIGVLKATSRLTEPAINRLRDSWASLYSGSKNSGKTVILEEGLDYMPISMKPNDLELVDSKKSTMSEICRVFGVPENMINAHLSKYNSNEENNLFFLQYTLAPILTAIEAGCDKALLLESEKEEGYFFRFDASELLRTTESEKIKSAMDGLKGGAVSLNETRAKLDLPKLDTDYYLWSLGYVLYNPDTEDMLIPNMMGQGNADTDQEKQKLEKPINVGGAQNAPTP